MLLRCLATQACHRLRVRLTLAPMLYQGRRRLITRQQFRATRLEPRAGRHRLQVQRQVVSHRRARRRRTQHPWSAARLLAHMQPLLVEGPPLKPFRCRRQLPSA